MYVDRYISPTPRSTNRIPETSATMNQHQRQILPEPDLPVPQLPALRIQPSSPSRHHPITPTTGAQRRVAIAVDLSDESAYAVKWAVNNYLRPGDAVILLHVRPTSVLYGADWGSIKPQITAARNDSSAPLMDDDVVDDDQKQLEDDFDSFTTAKANSLAQPLVEARIPFKIHIVKDHDMKERLCLEVERLGLSAVIMGSRGFGAARMRGRAGKGRLGSVSDYCVRHCICPVVVVRYPDDDEEEVEEVVKDGSVKKKKSEEVVLHPVPEEQEQEYHDCEDEPKDA